MLPASRAAIVPVFIATPTSAWASAGASLVPSPHIATSLPCACSSRISCSLCSGVACARKSSTPDSAAIAAAVSGLSPVIITVRMPILRKRRKALADAALDDVLQMDDAEQAAVLGDRERRAARLGDPLGDRLQLAHRRVLHHRDRDVAARHRSSARAAIDIGQHRIDRALADRGALDIDAADPRLRRERDEMRVERRHVAAADAVFLLGEDDDRAAFRRLVGQRGELRRIGEVALVDAAAAAGTRSPGGCRA